jgi:hypothetical protein
VRCAQECWVGSHLIRVVSSQTRAVIGEGPHPVCIGGNRLISQNQFKCGREATHLRGGTKVPPPISGAYGRRLRTIGAAAKARDPN